MRPQEWGVPAGPGRLESLHHLISRLVPRYD